MGPLRERRKQVLWELLQAIMPDISARLSERREFIAKESGESERECERLNPLHQEAMVEHRNAVEAFQNKGAQVRRLLNHELLADELDEGTMHELVNTGVLWSTSIPELATAALAIAMQRGNYQRSLAFHKHRVGSFETELSLIRRRDWSAWTELLKGEPKAKKTRRRYMVMKCPMTDCRGFISNYWLCDLCKQKICKHCREPILFVLTKAGVQAAQKKLEAGEPEVEVARPPSEEETDVDGSESDSEEKEEKTEVAPAEEVKEGEVSLTTIKRKAKSDAKLLGHVCDEKTLETVKLLASDTKSCPTCTTLITKIDGCDQMWCTQCQTAFSWNTNEIVKGRVHNPHYYEYQRQLHNGAPPREPGDNPCAQGLPQLWDVMDNTLGEFWLNHQVFNSLSDVHRWVLDLYEDKLPKERRPLTQYGHHHDLGIAYLQREMDEKEIRAELTLRERRIDLHQSMIDIIEMAYAVLGDVLRAVPKHLKQLMPGQRRVRYGDTNQSPVNSPQRREAEEWVVQVLNLVLYVHSEIQQVMRDHKRKGTALLMRPSQLNKFQQVISELPYNTWAAAQA